MKNAERIAEISARMQEISQHVETRGAEITTEELTALESEVAQLTQERSDIEADIKRREAIRAAVKQGGGNPIERHAAPSIENTDPTDTPEYRQAFMEHVCRGATIPQEFRAAATPQVTTTADAGVVIPRNTLMELIRELESYGEIYKLVRKLNIQGGVRVPILTLRPTAQWIGEGASKDQKIAATEAIEFTYHGIECKVAQTLLASIVTYEIFQREFVSLCVEAIVHEMERAIFNGTGVGQMLGITVDTRVPKANTISIDDENFASWAWWHKNVFAKMKKSYRGGVFVMAQGTFDGHINGMVDAAGQPIARVNYGITAGEVYQFGGKRILTVEDDIITPYGQANTGDVVAVFFNPREYAINSNMQMSVVKWQDHDNNQLKNKAIMFVDGKLLDPHGVLIIRKGRPAGPVSA